MSENSVPRYFKIVAIIGLIWNLLGVFSYIMSVMSTPEMMDAMPEAERAYLESIPAWVTGAYAIAVWVGSIGALGLVLKKSWAYLALIISLLGILIQNFYGFAMGGVLDAYGPTVVILPIIVIAFQVYLIMLAKKANDNGWSS